MRFVLEVLRDGHRCAFLCAGQRILHARLLRRLRAVRGGLPARRTTVGERSTKGSAIAVGADRDPPLTGPWRTQAGLCRYFAQAVRIAVDRAAMALLNSRSRGKRAYGWGAKGQIWVVEQPPSAAISCPVM